jgi:hypothetical protein
MPNYAFTTGKAFPDAENGKVFVNTNFHQREPHTPIFVGKTGLTFRNCNLINCDVPADSVIESGIRCHIEYCSNLHPEWVAKGLSACEENCSHVTATDSITIDSVVVDTVYHYADRRVA